jgi:hypothetical protein
MRPPIEPGSDGTFWAQTGSKKAIRFVKLDGLVPFGAAQRVEEKMDSIIYLVGLIVVIMAVLSFFGLH